MTVRDIAARAAALLGLENSVYVQTPLALGAIRGESFETHGLYCGQDVTGAHVIQVKRGLASAYEVYCVAHECVHAAQAERLGGSAKMRRIYGVLESVHGYRANELEVEARRRGAELTEIICAELEES